jgi:hypothetical protein
MQAAIRPLTRKFGLGALIGGALIAALAEIGAQPVSGDEAAVLAADTMLGEAVRSGDKSIARRLLSLQFTYVDENGKIYERKAFLDDLKGMAVSPAIDGKVKIYGRIAMVTGNRKFAQGRDAFFLDIWAKQKGAWRALTMQDVVLGAAGASNTTTAEALPAEKEVAELAKLYQCKNPCETIPYRVRSPAEQDIVNTFQAIEKATIARDADEYAKHLADEFVHYESDLPPVPKSERIARIEDGKKQNTPASLTAIQSMRLWIYGDGAAMISTHVVPEDTEPVLRIARVWVRRNGLWQMAISVQTQVK